MKSGYKKESWQGCFLERQTERGKKLKGSCLKKKVNKAKRSRDEKREEAAIIKTESFWYLDSSSPNTPLYFSFRIVLHDLGPLFLINRNL